MDCPECNTTNAEHARFCRKCGHGLHSEAATPAPTTATEAGSQCAHCAAPLRPGAAFCGRCGTATAPAAAAPAATAPESGATQLTNAPERSPKHAPAAPAAVTCSHCEAPLRVGALFCGRCGKSPTAAVVKSPAAPAAARAVSAPPTSPSGADTGLVCRHCAAPLRVGAVFCAACGTPAQTPGNAADKPAANEPASPASSIWEAATPDDGPVQGAAVPRPAPTSPTAAAPAQPGRVASNRKQPPLLAVVAIAIFGVALVVGGVVWWRMRDTGAGDTSPPASAGQSPADPAATASPQPEPITALPFVGDWLVEKDFSNPAQLPQVGIVRFSQDRFRFKETTNTVRYLARGDGRFGIRFPDDEGDDSGKQTADEDSLTVNVVDADHVTLSSQEFDLGLVRRDSAAGQAFLAKANALPTPAIASPVPKPVAKPAPAAKAAPSPIQLAINASLDEGRRCMASSKYDCAISSANAVLRLAPRNSAALAMKREAEAAQARALSEIEIR